MRTFFRNLFLAITVSVMVMGASPAFASANNSAYAGYTKVWAINTRMFGDQFTESMLLNDGAIPPPARVTAPKVLRANDGMPLIPLQYFVYLGGSTTVTSQNVVEILLPIRYGITATIVVAPIGSDWAIVNGQIQHIGDPLQNIQGTIYVPATLFNAIPDTGADWMTPLSGNASDGRIVLWHTATNG